ncbi:hypothetical protein NQ318_014302 [Aromia moschata]|uniref:DUF4817 domain-containing protein n=1 Tax=Aromia moschata TaxID=1265417 RepID=A0AAV8YYM7_9CUCU|nr:hypothetical protein NQ318_014302 [Aromia moschata]
MSKSKFKAMLIVFFDINAIVMTEWVPEGRRARTQCEVVRLFRETHPDLPPLNQGTISKIEAQYREMGHVRKVPSKRQAVVDDDTKMNLLLALEENPITPAVNWPVIILW